MSKELITYVVVPLNDSEFIERFYDLENFIRNANAVLVSGPQLFSRMLKDFPDDYEFRLVMHYGAQTRGGYKKSELVKSELAEYFPKILENKFVYMTRSQDLFPKQEPFR